MTMGKISHPGLYVCHGLPDFHSHHTQPHITPHSHTQGHDDVCLVCSICLSGVWHWIEEPQTWSLWLGLPILKCDMCDLMPDFDWIWHISHHTQPHITPHSHIQGPEHDDVCLACCICLLGVWHWIEELQTWSPWAQCITQDLICVMGIALF